MTHCLFLDLSVKLIIPIRFINHKTNANINWGNNEGFTNSSKHKIL